MSPKKPTSVHPDDDLHSECSHDWGHVRISDPCASKDYERALRDVTKDRESALGFLQKIGVCTADGKLAKRYGG